MSCATFELVRWFPQAQQIQLHLGSSTCDLARGVPSLFSLGRYSFVGVGISLADDIEHIRQDGILTTIALKLTEIYRAIREQDGLVRGVIVGVSIDLEIPRNEFPEQSSPNFKVITSVDNRFVPCRRQRFHAFAVTQPTHIDEINRYPIKLLLLPRTRHPRNICQCKRHIVFAKQIGQPPEPSPIPNFHDIPNGR